ncbi:MAG TPA: LacI family DNA-binding transcriptional regulator [Trebonia sp.]
MAVGLRDVARRSGVSVSTASRALGGSERVSAASEELRALGMPTVHLARRPAHPAGDCVLGDDITGARLAAEHLLSLGHRRIAVIAGPGRVQSGRERMAGFWLAMRSAGIDPDEGLAVAAELSPDAGAEAVAALLGLPAVRRPTALIIANHEAVHGALPALRERSVAVPAELSVICYEDSPLARWWHPAMTVIDNSARQMGELAARLLLNRLEQPGGLDGGREFSEFRVGGRLVERDSCLALPTACG